MRRLTDREYRLFLSAISHIKRQDKYAIQFMLTGKYIDIARLLEIKVQKYQRGCKSVFFEKNEKEVLRNISLMEMYVCEREDRIYGDDSENLTYLCKSLFDTLSAI